MAGWELKIIEAEARRLIALAAEDDDLRADLRALAQEILAATGGPCRHAEPVHGDVLNRGRLCRVRRRGRDPTAQQSRGQAAFARRNPSRSTN